jgi:hypothetical protein
MPSNNDYIDLNYEQISPQRAINGDSFTQGLCDWRFSISSSSGGAWIPSMSYFLIEYTFSNTAGDNGPLSSSKITLGCDWAANLFTASSFKVAQYEICNVNSFHAQTHCVKKEWDMSMRILWVLHMIAMVMTLIFQDVWLKRLVIVCMIEMDC